MAASLASIAPGAKAPDFIDLATATFNTLTKSKGTSVLYVERQLKMSNPIGVFTVFRELNEQNVKSQKQLQDILKEGRFAISFKGCDAKTKENKVILTCTQKFMEVATVGSGIAKWALIRGKQVINMYNVNPGVFSCEGQYLTSAQTYIDSKKIPA